MAIMTMGKALRLNIGDKIKRLDPKEKLEVIGTPHLEGTKVFVPIKTKAGIEFDVCHTELENK